LIVGPDEKKITNSFSRRKKVSRQIFFFAPKIIIRAAKKFRAKKSVSLFTHVHRGTLKIKSNPKTFLV
jgi:hypothetical protein